MRAATPQTKAPQLSPSGDPWLLTPGPLTTSPTVKAAMLHDYGSRDARFIAMNAGIRRRLCALAGGDGCTCVPLQGSGTFTVEAMLGTFVGGGEKILLLVNGAYGRRMAAVCARQGIAFAAMEWREDRPVDAAEVDRRLAADGALTHVAVVHCETTSGVLNPLAAIAACCARHGKKLLVDAMSTFGALPLCAKTAPFTAVAASANKCLEGVPGLGFCIAHRGELAQCAGKCGALSLDLHDQWRAMEAGGQWRFTPPTHAVAALHRALDELDAEGGVAGRGARYRDNCSALVSGMRARGFATLLADEHQAPVIVTFLAPAHANFNFPKFYAALGERGFLIYPGKLTAADTFRIGCIGRVDRAVIGAALAAVDEVLLQLGVDDCAPAAT
ncbi:MAG: 2-aminoethylphosphonate--pyruvate transaminase [Gammaproteobacteria bacterium]|nr:2-aminoethylphosphonate--pyruvate transaminase [Gammaproteobacteria bacterium]